MRGLHAYFRFTKERRSPQRKGGLHKYFSVKADDHPEGIGSCESSAGSRNRANPDVEMVESSDSDVEFLCNLQCAGMPQESNHGHRAEGWSREASRDLNIPEQIVGMYMVPRLSVPLLTQAESEAETLAKTCFEAGCATWTQLADIMRALPDASKIRWKQQENSNMEPPKSFMTGAWARGPHFGLTRTMQQFPWVSSLLAHILSGVDSSFRFSSCTFSRNVCSSPHRDSFNAQGSDNLVIPCSHFRGGEVWVQHPEGRTILSPQGEPGIMWDARTPTRFDPKAKHATAPWGGDRLILIGYHVRHVNKLSATDAEQLINMGFKPDFQLA